MLPNVDGYKQGGACKITRLLDLLTETASKILHVFPYIYEVVYSVVWRDTHRYPWDNFVHVNVFRVDVRNWYALFCDFLTFDTGGAYDFSFLCTFACLSCWSKGKWRIVLNCSQDSAISFCNNTTRTLYLLSKSKHNHSWRDRWIILVHLYTNN